jgi:hypothetical protein
MEDSEVVALISTLLLNGYYLDGVRRLSPTCSLLDVHKFDQLGAQLRYTILECRSDLSENLLKILRKASRENGSSELLLTQDPVSTQLNSFTFQDFYTRHGGVADYGILLAPELPLIMGLLGHNTLPDGFDGSPDDLLEVYTTACFRYLFNKPARRFGQDRRFEKLPDGIVFVDGQKVAQFDAKAYGKGFSIEADDLRRFASYVDDFSARYGAVFGKPFVFLVVSGGFNQSDQSIQDRSNEFYGMCESHLCCVTASELARFVQIAMKNAEYRSLINWKKLLAMPRVYLEGVEREIDAIAKDHLI